MFSWGSKLRCGSSMRTSIKPSMLAAILLFALDACGTPSEAKLLEDSSAFTISVTSGTTPTISWPGGKAYSFDIESGSGASTKTVWSFGAANPDVGFASPVKYGTLPAQASCAGVDEACPTAVALKSGTTYTIAITRLDGGIGLKQFKP